MVNANLNKQEDRIQMFCQVKHCHSTINQALSILASKGLGVKEGIYFATLNHGIICQAIPKT